MGPRSWFPAGALTSQVTITIASNPTAPIFETGTELAVAHIFGPEGQAVPEAGEHHPGIRSDALAGRGEGFGCSKYTAPLASNDYAVVPTTLTDSSHVTGTTMHFSNYLPAVPNAGSLDGGSADAATEASSDAAPDAADASLDASDAAD